MPSTLNSELRLNGIQIVCSVCRGDTFHLYSPNYVCEDVPVSFNTPIIDRNIGSHEMQSVCTHCGNIQIYILAGRKDTQDDKETG